MPFSFKPELSQGGEVAQAGAPQGAAAPTSTPQASFGGQSTQNLMARASEEGKSFFQMLLFFVFGASVLLALGLVGYKYYLSSQIEAKKATLASYESRLATLPLEEMRKLSNKIKLINQLVKEHPSVNVAFRIIEDSVENHVTYNRFELRYDTTAKAYSLQLAGVAPDYRGVAQQVDTLKRKPYTTYIPSVIVEGLTPDDLGRINFTMKLPISIMGLLPEGVNLSEGAAARIASSTLPTTVNQGTTTIPTGIVPPTGTTTGQRSSSTLPLGVPGRP